MSFMFENMFTPCLCDFVAEDSNHLYRIDWNGNDLHIDDYKILRRTEKGVWINHYGNEKFVLLTARKKFACETQKDALISFIARKNRQIRILSAQLDNARNGLAFARKINEEQGK